MRFDNHEPPKTILTQRDQRILIAMTLALGVVLFAIKVSSKPEFWARMFPEKFAHTPALVQDFDLELGEPARPMGENEFISTPESRSDQTAAPDRAAEIALSESTGSESRVPAVSSTPAASPMLATDLPDNVERPRSFFTASTLSDIRDNTVGVRTAESPVWFHMIAAARDSNPEQLERAAIDRPDFRVVMVNPDRFRGVPMTIEGELRRISKFRPSINSYGIDELYDAWLFTHDSGSNPYHVVCSSVSPDIPVSGESHGGIPVQVSGFFFKREHYMNRDRNLHAAPLILARHMESTPQIAVVAADTSHMQRYLNWFAFAVAIALGLTLWNFAVSDFAFRTSRVRRLCEPAPNANFDGIEATDLRDVFRQLAEL